MENVHISGFICPLCIKKVLIIQNCFVIHKNHLTEDQLKYIVLRFAEFAPDSYRLIKYLITHIGKIAHNGKMSWTQNMGCQFRNNKFGVMRHDYSTQCLYYSLAYYIIPAI